MKKQAFSLVELIIVILFLGILSVIAVLAVNAIYKSGADASEAKARGMVVLMIEDYLVEDFNPNNLDANCVATTPGGPYPYTCNLNALVGAGYIKTDICNKADNKKIDLTNTEFKVTINAEKEYVCSNCYTTFGLKNTNDSCSDIELQGGS